MTEYEILHYEIHGTPLKDLSTITFIGWIATKINNQPSNIPGVSEVARLITNPPMGKMSETMKIDIIRKLEKMGVQL